MAEACILYLGEFTCVFLLAVPPDWAGICHDAAYTCTVDGAEEALM